MNQQRIKILAFAICAILAPRAVFGQSAAEHIALGDREHGAFRPAQALVHFEAAVAQDSTNAVALGKASRTAVDVGEQEKDAGLRRAFYKKGESYARRAVAADPHNAEYQFDLARALGRAALSVGVKERVRYATEVRSVALEALRLDPNHPGALHVMGMWNAEVMRLNGVERFFAKNVLGGKVFGQANWKDAVSYMEKAVTVDPDRLTHHLDLAKVYLDVDDKARARQQLQVVVTGPQSDFNDPLYKTEAEGLLRKLK